MHWKKKSPLFRSAICPYIANRVSTSIRKIIAIHIVVIFLFQTTVSAAPLLAPPLSPILETNKLSLLQIPEEYGYISETGTPEGSDLEKPTILHIRDAHSNPEAQTNIYNILNFLAQEKKLGNVYVEAAFGDIMPELLRFSDLPKANDAVADYLLQKGELTGAELFSLKTDDPNILITGVEDPALYRQSFDFFVQLKKEAKTLQTILATYRKLLDAAERDVFSSALRSFVKKQLAWHENAETFWDYVETIRALAPELLQLDLSDPQNQFEWPNLVRVVAIQNHQSEMQRERLDSDLKSLSQIIQENLPKGALQEYFLEGLPRVAHPDEFAKWLRGHELTFQIRKSRHFFEALYQEVHKKEISLFHYPAFLHQAAILILNQEMDGLKLTKEIETLEPKIEKKLIKSKEEKELLLLMKDLVLLEKLLSLRMSREEYDLYMKRRSRLSSNQLNQRLKQFSAENKLALPALPSAAIEQAEMFYDLSQRRDESFVQKSLNSKTSQTEKINVLIAGGFHSHGIAEQLKTHGVNYAVLVPKIHSIDPAADLYEKVMLNSDSAGKHTAFNHLLGAAVILQHPQTYQGVMAGTPIADRQKNRLREAWESAGVPALQAAGWDSDGLFDRVQNRFKQLSPMVRTTQFRSEMRVDKESLSLIDSDALRILESLDNPDYKNQVIHALLKLRELKSLSGQDGQQAQLMSRYAESLMGNGPPRDIPRIEVLMDSIYYQDYKIADLPIPYRVAFVLGALDAASFEKVHEQLVSTFAAISLEKYQNESRFSAQDYAVVMRTADQEHLQTIDQNILLRTAINRFVIDLPRLERRALEEEALIGEFVKELRQPGSGQFPTVVFITDIHGGKKIGDLIGFSLGLQNYRNITSVAELESRLMAEGVRIQDLNIRFVGFGDYVDRGPKPYWGFQFIIWLRSHGKLKFLNGNHDIWKDQNILGVHLLVNDALRAIANSEAIEVRVDKHLKTIDRFISTFGLNQEQIEKVNAEKTGLMERFLARVRAGQVGEDVIQAFADEIIDMGANPNHSLDWWARDWARHAGWADTFFDHINEILINQVIRDMNGKLENNPSLIGQIQALLQSTEALSETLKNYSEAIQGSLQEGKLFGFIDADAFSADPSVRKAKNEIEDTKKENADIRRRNEELSTAGRHSERVPQLPVPTVFPQTSQIAAQKIADILTIAEELNRLVQGLDLPTVLPELVTPENYRSNRYVMETTLWNLKNFRLIYVDVYGNAYLHGMIPIDSDKAAFRVEYKGRKGVEAMELMQYEVRKFFESYEAIEDTETFRREIDEKLGEIFRILGDWYSDTTAYLKPPAFAHFLKNGGPAAYSYAASSAFSPRAFNPRSGGILHVGHIDLQKMQKEKLPYWTGGVEGGMINGDHDISEGYNGLGAEVTHNLRDAQGNLTGVRRFGYAATVVSLTKELKEAKKEVANLRGKLDLISQSDDSTEAQENRRNISAKMDELTNEVKRLEEKLANHEQSVAAAGGETITDITLHELPDEEIEKVQNSLDGRNYLLYLLERFLDENIMIYKEELIPGAENRGLKDRVAYYQSKITEFEKLQQEYASEFSRSEVRGVQTEQDAEQSDFVSLSLARSFSLKIHRSSVAELEKNKRLAGSMSPIKNVPLILPQGEVLAAKEQQIKQIQSSAEKFRHFILLHNEILSFLISVKSWDRSKAQAFIAKFQKLIDLFDILDAIPIDTRDAAKMAFERLKQDTERQSDDQWNYFFNRMKDIWSTREISAWKEADSYNKLINLMHLAADEHILKVGARDHLPILDLHYFQTGQPSPILSWINQFYHPLLEKDTILVDETQFWIQKRFNLHAMQGYARFVSPALGGIVQFVFAESGSTNPHSMRIELLARAFEALGYKVERPSSQLNMILRVWLDKDSVATLKELKSKFRYGLLLLNSTRNLYSLLRDLQSGYAEFFLNPNTMANDEKVASVMRILVEGLSRRLIQLGGIFEADHFLGAHLVSSAGIDDDEPFPTVIPLNLDLVNQEGLSAEDRADIWTGNAEYNDPYGIILASVGDDVYPALNNTLERLRLPKLPPYDAKSFGQPFIDQHFNEVLEAAIKRRQVLVDSLGRFRFNRNFKSVKPVQLFLDNWVSDENREEMVVFGSLINQLPLRFEHIGIIGGARIFKATLEVPTESYEVYILRGDENQAGYVLSSNGQRISFAVFQKLLMDHGILNNDLVFSLVSHPGNLKSVALGLDQTMKQPTRRLLYEGDQVKAVALLPGIATGEAIIHLDSHETVSANNQGGIVFAYGLTDVNMPVLNLAHGLVTRDGNPLDHLNMRAKAYGKPRLHLDFHISQDEEGPFIRLPVVRRESKEYRNYQIITIENRTDDNEQLKDIEIRNGDLITLSGNTGAVYVVKRNDDIQEAFYYLRQLENNSNSEKERVDLESKLLSVLDRIVGRNAWGDFKFILLHIFLHGSLSSPLISRQVQIGRDESTFYTRLIEILYNLPPQAQVDIADFLSRIGEYAAGQFKIYFDASLERIANATRVDQLYYESSRVYRETERLTTILAAIAKINNNRLHFDDVNSESAKATLHRAFHARFDNLRAKLFEDLDMVFTRYEQFYPDPTAASYLFLVKRILERVNEFERISGESLEGDSRVQILRGWKEELDMKEKLEILESETSKKLFLPLDRISSNHAHLVGPKAANLGWLKNFVRWYTQTFEPDVEVHVPNGEALTIVAYQAFLDQLIVGKEAESELSLRQRVSNVLNLGLSNVEKEAVIAGLFGRTPFPEALFDKLETTEEKTLAVRSSTGIEDQPTASAAGVFHSSLGLRTAHEIQTAIERTWASLFSAAALDYYRDILHRENLSADEFNQGAILQDFVNGEVSGVITTANIASDDRGSVLINAGWGLGETLVSGDPDVRQEGDIYIVDKLDATIDRVLGSKLRKMHLDEQDGKVRIHTTSEEERSGYVLSDKVIHRLTHLALMIEEWFGYVSDIEFTIKEGVIYLVQVRPVPGFKITRDQKKQVDSWLNNGNGVNDQSRSELRAASKIENGYEALTNFLSPNRSYLYARWVAVHVTDGIFLPLPAELLSVIKPFLTADVFEPVGNIEAVLSDAKTSTVGLDLSILEHLPPENDLFYLGIAKVLRDEPARYVRLLITDANQKDVDALNAWFSQEFREYGDLDDRFQVVAVPSTQTFNLRIQKVIEEVRRLTEKRFELGSHSSTEFFKQVTLSSSNLSLLERVLAPVGWRIHNDVRRSAAVQSHLIRRKLDLAQGHLTVEKIKQLTEIQSRVISAAREILSGEDLSSVERMFEVTIAAVRKIYQAA